MAEAYLTSLETARRYHDLAVDVGIPRVSVVANTVRDGHGELVVEYCDNHGFDLLGSVPFEPMFGEAERLGMAPYDVARGSAGVDAIRTIVRTLESHAAF